MLRKNIIPLSRLFRLLLWLLPVTCLGGCGLIGGFYGVFIDRFIPRAPVPAEHDMSDKTVLIWVDYQPTDQQNHMLSRELTQQLSQELQHQEAIGPVIDYQKIVAFRLAHPEFARMTIQQLGQQFAADEVLYLLIDKFELRHEAGQGFYKPSIIGYAKVIDAVSGKRLWPTDRTQRPFTLETELTADKETALEPRLVRELCAQAAQNIARYFYKHQVSREEKKLP